MGNCSRILVWTIPWAEAPGELQSVGPQRVGHRSSAAKCFSLTWRHVYISLRVLLFSMSLGTSRFRVASLAHAYHISPLCSRF